MSTPLNRSEIINWLQSTNLWILMHLFFRNFLILNHLIIFLKRKSRKVIINYIFNLSTIQHQQRLKREKILKRGFMVCVFLQLAKGKQSLSKKSKKKKFLKYATNQLKNWNKKEDKGVRQLWVLNYLNNPYKNYYQRI